MLIMLPMVGFVLQTLVLRLLWTRISHREVIVRSVLLMGVVTVLFTELLSLLTALQSTGVGIAWSLHAAICLAVLLRKGNAATEILGRLRSRISDMRRQADRSTGLIALACIAQVLIIAVQAVVYPPNNFDSLTYHLSRTVHWISHGSVEHFATHIFRQLYQPPFAEYVITHGIILSRGDMFSNLVQLAFLLFSVLVVSEMMGSFGGRVRSIVVPMALLLTMPMAVLQASSTQNDIVAGFFILCAVHYVKRILEQSSLMDHVFLGMAVGLALLTKGTAYIFLAPIGLYLMVESTRKAFKEGDRVRYLKSNLSVLVLILVVNAGHFGRNISLTGHPLGIDRAESALYSNTSLDAKLWTLNIVKNVALHLGPGPLGHYRDVIVYKLHLLLGADPDEQWMNFNGERYFGRSEWFNHEDFAPNTAHLILLLVSVPFLLFGKWGDAAEQRSGIKLLVLVVLQLLLFTAYLKWQPWHSRLHLPIFFLVTAILSSVILNSRPFYRVFLFALPLVFVYAFAVSSMNRIRPLVSSEMTADVRVSSDRFEKYFANMPHLHPEYKVIAEMLAEMKCVRVGIMMGLDTWEYPLYKFNDSVCVRPVHVQVSNVSGTLQESEPVDAIVIAGSVRQLSGDYANYINRTEGHRHIMLFTRVR